MNRRTLLQGVLAFVGLSRFVQAKPVSGSPKWRNFTTTYTNISRDEMVKKMRDAMKRTTFIPPVSSHHGITYWIVQKPKEHDNADV